MPSHIPAKDMDYLEAAFPSHIGIFDKAFASGWSGLSKPDPAFFELVMNGVLSFPGDLIFVNPEMYIRYDAFAGMEFSS